MATAKHFHVDARTILQLGRQSIKDHTTALLELVKNSYDADARLVDVVIEQYSNGGCIRVADDGVGMTEQEIEAHWLRIGYSEKRTKKFSPRGRRKTGEKGVGRISADRLGARLFLKTQAFNSLAAGIAVDWDRFDVEGQEVSEIPIRTLRNVSVSIPTIDSEPKSTRGTELIIRKLRQAWTEEDIRALHEELSALTPPFRAVEDFRIRLTTNIAPKYNGIIESQFSETAEIELSAVMRGDRVRYYIRDRIATTSNTAYERGVIGWHQITHRARVSPDSLPKHPRTGPVKLRILFYLKRQDLLAGTNFRVSDLREFLNRNAGVKIYRDNVRVKPYGDPGRAEGDWLGLAERKTREPAGISRPTFRVAANQVVGAVFLSRDKNPHLIDSAAREGLIHGEAYADLRALVLGCLSLMETHRHEAYKQRSTVAQTPNPREEIRSLTRELANLQKDLLVVQESVPDSAARSVVRALDQVSFVTTRINAARESLEEMMSQAGVLRGLATIGISASVFGHETQSAISSFLASTTLATELLRESPTNIDLAVAELMKASRYAEQVGAWGSFALSRVKRDKRRRRKFRVHDTLHALARDLSEAYSSSSTELQTEFEPVTAQTFEMDIEAVVLNLMTNAYVACQQSTRRRVVRLELHNSDRQGQSGFVIRVADSGPGVPDRLRERIWNPLFTTRKNEQGDEVGTGLGLSIVESIVEELRGTRSVSRDPQLEGAQFEIWLPAQ
jgi:signal transduction histidine kinase